MMKSARFGLQMSSFKTETMDFRIFKDEEVKIANAWYALQTTRSGMCSFKTLYAVLFSSKRSNELFYSIDLSD